MVPAMLLQPLVENSVAHGFERKEAGEIRIGAEEVGGDIVLSVSDNGDGMSDLEIEKLYDTIDDGSSRVGIGLKNVMRRVILSTNGKGRLDIRSEPGRGTIITIRMPIQRLE